MTWNYRVVRKKAGNQDVYTIREVYYTDGKPDSVTVKAAWPAGFTIEELEKDLEHYCEALKKPVLDYQAFLDMEELIDKS